MTASVPLNRCFHFYSNKSEWQLNGIRADADPLRFHRCIESKNRQRRVVKPNAESHNVSTTFASTPVADSVVEAHRYRHAAKR
jgi:hypothetical protein